MELWILFVFIAIVLTVVLILFDYNFLKRIFKDPETPSIIACLFTFPVIVYGLISGIDVTNIFIFVLSLLGGVGLFIGSYYFSKALYSNASPGMVTSILKLEMVFVFIVGIFVFGETLTKLQFIGHFLILFGAIFLSLGHFKAGHLTAKALFFSVVSAIGYSIATILGDYLYKISDFITVFTLFSISYFLGGFALLFFTKNGKNFFKEIGLHPKLYLKCSLVTETLAILQIIFSNLALKFGPLTLVVFLNKTYVAFLFLICFVFGYFYPQYFPDEGGDQKVLRFTIVLLMIFGVYLAIFV